MPQNGLEARYGELPHTHRVPDVLVEGLTLVFCGTALGYASAANRAYYAHAGNRFWKTLYRTGLTPRLLLPEEFACVTAYGFGLTDLCKNAYGSDNQLPADALDANALLQKIMRYQPGIVAFTSKTAASAFLGKPTAKIAYGFQWETCGKTIITVLPSPSGQARIFWDEKHWQQLADRVHSVRHTGKMDGT